MPRPSHVAINSSHALVGPRDFADARPSSTCVQRALWFRIVISTVSPSTGRMRTSPQLFADDRQACLPLSERPARYFAESQSWGRGDLQWNQPSIIYTRNRKLVMGMDGNFVLYGLDRTDGGTGGIKAEVLLWSTNTQNYPGARVSFGDDGLLTVHDLFERLRFSSGKPARKLVLRADGALVLLDDDGNVITRLGG